MYKYLWSECQKEEVIRNAWNKMKKGKGYRKDVKKIDANLNYYISKMQIMFKNTRPGEVEHPELAFEPVKHIEKTVIEHGKEREICCPSIWEQWVHHIVVQVLSPIIIKTSYEFSCGSMPNRGSKLGKREMERLIKKGFRYFAKIDVRHFFKNIRMEIVEKSLREVIDDDWFIYLIKVIFKHYKKGLPLGFYISQWLSNFILRKVDYAIMEEKPIGMVRYVDDIVIASNNKKHLRKILGMVKERLGQLRLKLKNNWQICRFEFVKKSGKVIGRRIDFMGFLFGRKTTCIRKKIMLRAVRLAKRIGKCAHIAKGQAASMISRAGWFKNTDTRNVWEERIKPFVDMKQLKKIISKWQRRRNSEKRMERGKKLGTTGTVQTDRRQCLAPA